MRLKGANLKEVGSAREIAKLKLITGRSNGMGYERRKEVLRQTIRGWVNYFKLADAKKYLRKMDEWLRGYAAGCIIR